MSTDPVLAGWFSPATLELLHTWGGPIGAIIVVGVGYLMVGRHRALKLDEILAGVGLLVWIVADLTAARVFGHGNALTIWSVRGVVLAVLIVAYFICRGMSKTGAKRA